MGTYKSLDCIEYNLVVSLIQDAHSFLGELFNSRALRLTLKKVKSRFALEGIGFLTKTLPSLGRCLDKALAGHHLMNRLHHGFKPMNGTELPKLFGELFMNVFDREGRLLPNPDAKCISVLRGILHSFGKYKLPYTSQQEQKVLDQFVKTEEDLIRVTADVTYVSSVADCYAAEHRVSRVPDVSNDFDQYMEVPLWKLRVVRRARILLARLLARFNPKEIVPRHGPGVVSTGQQHRAKFEWTNISERITDLWPIDEYFCSSGGHVCDRYDSFDAITKTDLPAKVILVPKDSRGPRLISCEPVEFQWIQQGLRRSLYDLVERAPLTRYNVFFTNQQPNQYGALLGSSTGRYATLDLKEASDRVSCALVSCLFPSHVTHALMASRTVATVLPDGRVLNMNKFAPMGSALCFPIMALTIWSLLTAAAPNTDTREGILVYGDDVVVPTGFAGSAIKVLEAFGLKVNADKCCFQGSFRESCGVDAFQGVNVTPTRIRAEWKRSPATSAYESWISYANSYYRKRCYHAHDLIVRELHRVYGAIPDKSLNISGPSLYGSQTADREFRSRTNTALQKREYKIRVTEDQKFTVKKTGWEELLRYFSECSYRPYSSENPNGRQAPTSFEGSSAFSSSSYTHRRTTRFVWRWRQVL